jgi:hypothetical protein
MLSEARKGPWFHIMRWAGGGARGWEFLGARQVIMRRVTTLEDKGSKKQIMEPMCFGYSTGGPDGHLGMRNEEVAVITEFVSIPSMACLLC